MKIRTIQAHAGRTLSVAGLPYSSVRPSMNMTAELEDGEDPVEKLKELHVMVESLLEDHCDELIAFAHARQQQRRKKAKQPEPVKQG